MRALREINWWQLIDCYKWFRAHKCLPPELAHYAVYGQTKEKYVQIFAYIMEHLTEKKRATLPKRCEQLYNWIFMDEHEKGFHHRSGKESTYNHVIKNGKLGHTEGTQAYIIVEMLFTGGYSILDMAKAVGSSEGRVRSMFYGIKTDHPELEIVSIRRGGHNVYYIKERKEESNDPKGNNNKLTVRGIDGTAIGLKSSKPKRNTKKNSQVVL